MGIEGIGNTAHFGRNEPLENLPDAVEVLKAPENASAEEAKSNFNLAMTEFQKSCHELIELQSMSHMPRNKLFIRVFSNIYNAFESMKNQIPFASALANEQWNSFVESPREGLPSLQTCMYHMQALVRDYKAGDQYFKVLSDVRNDPEITSLYPLGEGTSEHLTGIASKWENGPTENMIISLSKTVHEIPPQGFASLVKAKAFYKDVLTKISAILSKLVSVEKKDPLLSNILLKSLEPVLKNFVTESDDLMGEDLASSAYINPVITDLVSFSKSWPTPLTNVDLPILVGEFAVLLDIIEEH